MKKLLRTLYQPYKWFIFGPFIVCTTFLCGGLATLSAILSEPRYASIFGVIWARLNSLATPMVVKIRGKENISKTQSYVIVSNHQSQYDIFVLYGWLGIDFKWVMKQELRKVPALGIACEKIGRQARLVELDERFCDVIVKRWQDFTGREATLLATGEKFNGLPERVAV